MSRMSDFAQPRMRIFNFNIRGLFDQNRFSSHIHKVYCQIVLKCSIGILIYIYHKMHEGTLSSFFSNLLVNECLRIIILLFCKAHFYKKWNKYYNILLLFQNIQKILNIDIPKTFALKTRMRISKNAEHPRMRMRISNPSLHCTHNVFASRQNKNKNYVFGGLNVTYI